MIENSTLKIGGNTIFVWFGKKLKSIGEKLTIRGEKISTKNTPTLVTNPSAKLINPFTLLISFTVDNTDKYQIVIQGDYKQNYRDCEDGAIKLTEDEVFLIINQHQNTWFKKE